MRGLARCTWTPPDQPERLKCPVLPGRFPVLSQGHLPGVRRHGGCRGGKSVHEGSLRGRGARGELLHLPHQPRSGRDLHLILLANLLDRHYITLLQIISHLLTLWFRRLFFC